MSGIEGLEAFTNVVFGDADEWTTGDSPPSQADFDIFNGLNYVPGHDGQQPQQPSHRHHLNAIQSPLPDVGLNHVADKRSESNNESAQSSSSSKQAQEQWSQQSGSFDSPMTDLGDQLDFQQFLQFDGGEEKDSPKKTVNPKLFPDSSHDARLGSPDGSCGLKDEPLSPVRVKPNYSGTPTTREPHAPLVPQGAPASSGRVSRGHQKATSQYSLAQSMPGLSIGGSREVSPTDPFIFSQGGSPLPPPINPSPSAKGINFGVTMDQMNLAIQGLPSADPNNSLTQLPQHMGPLSSFAPLSHDMELGMNPPAMALGPTKLPATLPTLRLMLKEKTGQRRKCRVETQFDMFMTLFPMPSAYRSIRLPKHTIGKSKFYKSDENTEDMLQLSVMLVRTSNMLDQNKKKRALARALGTTNPPTDGTKDLSNGENKADDDSDLIICQNCINRETKRAGRKKNRKEPANDELWTRLREDRIILFNDYEILDWKEGGPLGKPAPGAATVKLPMRICCYGRHHSEKVGFQVIFTIKDCHGNFIAQNIAESIMITDDHKTAPEKDTETQDDNATQQPRPTTNLAASPPSPSSQNVLHGSHSTPNIPALQGQAAAGSSSVSPPHIQASPNAGNAALSRNLSRPASPNGLGAPMAKKRKGSGPKVPNELAMTRLETSAAQLPGNMSTHPATATSPFTPIRSAHALQTPFGAPFLPHAAAQMPGMPTIGDANDPFALLYSGRSLSREPETGSQAFSASTSKHTSRASSPNGMLGVSPATLLPVQHLQNSMGPARGAPAPAILRVVPAEGSKSGAYEVSILGTNFQSGMEVMFGDHRAIATTYWGEGSLLAIVPAAQTAGIVNVTLRHPNGQPALPPNHKFTTFKYNDDDEHELMRTALAVLSKKWQSNDIPGVARHIINSSQWSSSGQGAGGPGRTAFNGFTGRSTLEMQLLKVCELVDMDDSATKAYWNLRKKTTGQTMLHLASAMGFQRLVAGLLARGANPDVRDNAGYTPMHLAALNRHPEIVRRLVQRGADPTFRTLSGLTPAEMAPESEEVFAATRSLQRHSRTRSATSLHSHVSSAASLKSLWEPADNNILAAEYKVDSPEASGESLESSQDSTSEDGDDVDDGEWLDMRRSSIHSRRVQEASPTPIDPSTDELVPAAMASPAIATLREQLAHLQHFVSQQFQTSINMPNPLPDYYRPYFNTGALQRISALVPSIGARPGSAHDGPGSKEIEGKWWDLTSLISNYATPPPAYDDIFPLGDLLDTKQATAAGAAADAEADAKCTALFDQLSSTEEVAPSTSKSVKQSATATANSTALARPESRTRPHELPRILQIGPKNKIPTKEEQEAFRREHEKVQKPLSSDKKLFWVWIPILSVMLLAMLSSWFPGLFDAAVDYLGPCAKVIKRYRTVSRLLWAA